ncbi:MULTISPECIES: type II toxin-antitoxin system Phd/YefM family antitoxin [unclassified Pseudoalteromonas]|uniref:type II toxin-antitoxin system Phd/YefM family antitoxin n=1 Tax=unclassified Pseudoalteromonas TaxID=194690 RepID=UPI0004085C4E|nr:MULTISPECIES: type II toxin-antitoxin system Phd/YefM family antitoxin [unclassified Pseudoalteromonas]MDC9498824.1 type II toxin-antitoxin system Phd/YefM family antitoxin [Pseudoalteromonas sp. Angola-20]MDC9518601.1 type II toxin-antitoxin system Phd/YefM family antitoxin [Pseudoalteromonas sp. Angola-22]MDC9535008.1 type II toxin-antitoxin system Phd/YefM family antitoxin [Pseudoalteromonas sp. Angola-9]TMP78307.1 primosomal protein DnaT [Pseudoalteromonas sp. S983]
MRQVLADCSASISELKKNPTALLNEADGAAIAILNHNKPAAYLVPAQMYEQLIEQLDDYELTKVVESRRGDLSQAVEVSIDDL